MLSTYDVINYMLARRIEGTDYIQAASDNPVLLQAELDGYAVREGDRWRGLGIIKTGERRTVRFIEGGEKVIVGE